MNREFAGAYFMWKRELIRFFRSPSRVIGSLGMPFFYLAILGSGLNGAVNTGSAGGNYMEFIAPGILSMVILFGSIFSGIQVIMDRQFGFLKETLVAPVRRESIVFGKAVGGATTAVLQGMLMLGIAAFLGVAVQWQNLPAAILVMAATSVTFVAFGIAIASVMDDMHGFQLVTNFLVMPMFFLSGALFPLSSAPQIVRTISLFDPLTYAVEALRALLVGQAATPLLTSAAAIAVCMSVAFFGAVALFDRIEE